MGVFLELPQSEDREQLVLPLIGLYYRVAAAERRAWVRTKAGRKTKLHINFNHVS